MLFRRNYSNRSLALPAFSFCEPTAEGLKSWIKILPKTDPHALANKLIQAGEDIATSQCELEQALPALDMLATPLHNAAQGLTQFHSKDQSDSAALLKQQRLYSLYGQIYFFTAQKHLELKSGPACDGLMLTASGYLCRAMLTSYQLQESAPSGCWKQLHAIYLYSITDSHSATTATRLDDNYKAMVSLACANPDKLNSTQLASLFDYLQNIDTGVRINATPTDQSHFKLATHQDVAPQRYLHCDQHGSQAHSETTPAATLYLNFQKLQSDLSSSSLSPELIGQLANCFDASPHRTFNRALGAGTLDICHGFEQIHYYLSGEKSFESFTRPFINTYTVDDLSSINSMGEPCSKTNDIWKSDYKTGWNNVEFSGDSIEFKIRTSLDNEDKSSGGYNLNSITIVDTNPTGYCLSGHHLSFTNYKSGNLIGLRDAENGKWNVAVIRWTKNEDDQRKLGVELLGPDIKPYGIKIIHSKQGTELLPALGVSPLKKDRSTSDDANLANLIIPNLGLKAKSAATLIGEDVEQRIILSDCVEKTNEYCRYAHTTLTDAPPYANAPTH